MLDGLSFLIVGSYLGVVLYRGNAKPLFLLLKDDVAFVEFALALASLGWMYKSPTLHPIGRGLIISSFVLIGLRLIHSQSSLLSAIGKIGQGADVIQTLKAVTGPPSNSGQNVGGATISQGSK